MQLKAFEIHSATISEYRSLSEFPSRVKALMGADVKTVFVVDAIESWPVEMSSGLTTAVEYLTDETFKNGQCDRVANLCQWNKNMGTGFYVSLVAEARGHEVWPEVKTIESLPRNLDAIPGLKDVEQLANRLFTDERLPDVAIQSYFGVDPGDRFTPISQQLFGILKIPLFEAVFRLSDGAWHLSCVQALASSEISEKHRDKLAQAAIAFTGGQPKIQSMATDRPALAILHTPDEPLPPSNPTALRNFERAARRFGMHVEIIDRKALDRLQEFDALFIRDTTMLNHYTFDFAQRAAALGMVVIDDPDSILQCNNKVYLEELLARHGIPRPKSMMVHKANINCVVENLGLPCILKQPDGSFSLGVSKVQTEEELNEKALALLDESDFIVAQEFLPTEFDWRVTVFDGRPLFVCKYFMAPGHWQVHKYEHDQHSEGRTVALSVGETPPIVVNTALRAADLIGKGLYGVDLKQAKDQCYVIEINDNPNIDAGNEDGVLKDALYREVVGVFIRRIRERELLLGGEAEQDFARSGHGSRGHRTAAGS
jgi:glutathione synthase/RimK-type ligase-like ATP-grasp enzyme